MPSKGIGLLGHLMHFCAWLLALGLVFLAVSGGIAYVAAEPGGMLQGAYWELALWYVLDIHAVLGLLVIVAAALYVPLRLARRGMAGPGRAPRFPGKWAALAALLVCLAAMRFVVESHPVLVHDRRTTDFPASRFPDQVVLTWSGAPQTTQTVQWRSAARAPEARLRYRPAGVEGAAAWQYQEAETVLLKDPYMINDPEVARHTVSLTDLEPGATYTYQAGTGGIWSEPAQFQTAPANADTFRFMYLGDAQTGLDAWGGLLHDAYARHPEAAFCILAGDLVNRGGDRADWDAFFAGAGGVYDRCPLVPAIGNHDDDDPRGPWLYLDLFDLPDNGPEQVEPERAYSFTYGTAFFVVLDSNLPPETQTDWLDQQLASSRALWKIAVYHHPVYPSKPSRDNPEIRQEWAPLFDQYGVDLALQGHDHAYMRTHPLRGGARVDTPADGTVYVMAVSGTKFYEQELPEVAAIGFEDLQTYQMIDIAGRRLTYRAYDAGGQVVDELIIRK